MTNTFEQAKIYISNLPNTTSRKDILEYLETAGPIKDSNFDQNGQRLAATIVYYHSESAELAKKFLDQREFNTRKIKISNDHRRDIERNSSSNLRSRLAELRGDEKDQFFSYLKALRDEEGRMFEDFLAENPQLVDILLNF